MRRQIFDDHLSHRVLLKEEEHVRQEALHGGLDVEGDEGQGKQETHDDEDDDLAEHLQVEGAEGQREEVVDRDTVDGEGEARGDHWRVVGLLVLQDVDVDGLGLAALNVQSVI